MIIDLDELNEREVQQDELEIEEMDEEEKHPDDVKKKNE